MGYISAELAIEASGATGRQPLFGLNGSTFILPKTIHRLFAFVFPCIFLQETTLHRYVLFNLAPPSFAEARKFAQNSVGKVFGLIVRSDMKMNIAVRS